MGWYRGWDIDDGIAGQLCNGFTSDVVPFTVAEEETLALLSVVTLDTVFVIVRFELATFLVVVSVFVVEMQAVLVTRCDDCFVLSWIGLVFPFDSSFGLFNNCTRPFLLLGFDLCGSIFLELILECRICC